MKQTSLTALIDRFDTFLLDQFGVLLDGAKAYPGAPEALAELSRRGKSVGILTNSGKRAGPNADRLQAMGFDPSHIDAVISSGEAARAVLSGRIGSSLARSAKVLVLSRGGDVSCIEGLDLTPTEDTAIAELVLITGSRGEEISLDQYADLLKGPATRGIPALCTNPDMTMLTERGPAFGAGRIAQLYRELGGKVDEVGKPHPLIYQVAIDRLGAAHPARVLCIGDSPAHDIRGAHGAGCRAALVRTGIHADEPLDQVLADAPPGDHPDFVIPSFAL
ncbi:HAD superfamily protein involved in N-acetyl-glucosamine catabolism [Candidatus Rhodobacter oscarellae]|uniref:HAD superfamily protein involved in N-acetyl-glucosamine catabolism n=1 Tax=Candidatus Rhodobacter oscarellae TaxID=1675527 RepID=A0A0J9DZS0_9RHOB|nr:TIGR01459 family HAD-type hydrolase [Candidatus Rhodobacter lobularis]KMW56161.1 HAD superfamily protein involved in N-acetyl-glucosamine catabolism [Candidatus Rhodobacter lobularis]